jgi:EPS-associated MarR family transcriptional regulator
MNTEISSTPLTRTSNSELDSAAALYALRLLAERPELSQRQLSKEMGLSLGKTHYVLHALLDKGLVKIKNFKRNDNKLAYAYLLTPKGMKAKLSLTRTFLAQKEAEFESLKATIAWLKKEVLHERATSTTDIAP